MFGNGSEQIQGTILTFIIFSYKIFFQEKLTSTVKEAASQCKRDSLWQKLLHGVAGEIGTSKKKEDVS